ncbi:MAG: type II toxin-antitoxin system prevent-host-death family antitoxin [Raoultibacter sp.]
MPIYAPIQDMQDTAAFSKLVENSPEPIIITKNGCEQFVVICSKDYNELRELQAKNQIMERLLVAERERAIRTHKDTKNSISSLRNQYDL